ncbi:DUF962 domain-containing protein [Pseudofrancisella aestuarii]|uniref:DUF962 domain-containing protein n=1 Tax=Pseudofrancisella aestuarii TaxID=2670347 RepID=A0ABV9TAV4_9GAMM|nr:Mpo1-like protein [Pseudofrancisella aestuarii]
MARNLQDLLDEYASSHQNKTNQFIHSICVPAILFSILGILWSISPWVALVAIVLSLLFYATLSVKYTIAMIIVSIIMLAVISVIPHIFFVSILVFVVSWIFQFYGHYLEGKNPSFLEDIQFLLIGPLWVLKKHIFIDK